VADLVGQVVRDHPRRVAGRGIHLDAHAIREGPALEARAGGQEGDLPSGQPGQVEVDEPEVSEAPLMIAAGETPSQSAEEDTADMERMTEEDLLRGLEGLPPAESPGSQRSGY